MTSTVASMIASSVAGCAPVLARALPELSAGLGRIGCPTAIIWGDRDRYIPFATARELAERIPGAMLTQLTGADHYIMEERPAEVTDALLELLARPCVISGGMGNPPA
jgi:pimeloyl-ACP methyl ester carboxylesterase